MQLKPKTWSHRHIQRLYHMSMLATFCFIVGAVIYGIFFSLWQVDALTLSSQSDQSVSATVPGITESPAVVDAGSSGSVSSGGSQNTAGNPLALTPPPIDNSPPAAPQAPEAGTQQQISVIPQTDAGTQEVVIAGKKVTVPAFATQNPSFNGSTLIKNAIIFLEIHSAQIIRGTTYADALGHWSWQSPEPVTPGIHTLFVVAQDEQSPQNQVSSSFNFYIKPGSLAKPSGAQAQPGNLAEPGNGGNLFDVLVRIPPQFKTIAPGDDVVASIQLINFGSSGNPVDVNIQYTLEGPNGEIVSQNSETAAVATKLSLVKTFHTNPDVSPGIYTLTLRVPSKGIIASSADSFEIKGSPVIPLGQNGKIDFTVVFQGFLALLFIFSLVLYFEYNKVSVLSRLIKKVDEQDIRLYNH